MIVNVTPNISFAQAEKILGEKFGELSQSTSEWVPVDPNESGSDFLERLKQGGWDPKDLEPIVQPSENYNVFQRHPSPGIVEYLGIPQSGEALQFSPPNIGPMARNCEFAQAGWNAGTSSKQIRDEILEGMQSAIDALCGMKAKPSEIGVKASAFGVLEIEAKWTASEACIE